MTRPEIAESRSIRSATARNVDLAEKASGGRLLRSAEVCNRAQSLVKQSTDLIFGAREILRDPIYSPFGPRRS